MHYGRQNQQFEYTMSNNLDTVQVQAVSEGKDLGVTFTPDLKFSKHISATANKANRVVGAIRRSYRYIDKTMLVQLHMSLVRSHLEYANTINKTDIDHLERIQRRATKLVPEPRKLSYPERLRQLPGIRAWYIREKEEIW